MKRTTLLLVLGLFLALGRLGAITLESFWESTRRVFSFDDPELFLIYPTQGEIPCKDGVFRFSMVKYSAPGGEAPFSKYFVRLSITDANGEFHEFQDGFPHGHLVEFPLPELPPGQISYTAVLTKGKKDAPLKIFQGRLNVVPAEGHAAPKGACILDRHGRAIVDGKPFLPIGLYFGGVDEEDDLERFLDSDFNCIMPYASQCLRLKNTTAEGTLPQTTEFLDFLEAKGKKIIFSLKGLYELEETKEEGRDFQKHFGGETMDETVTNIVTAFRNHPALLAWYINDEIKLANRPLVDARRTLVHELDPKHPTWGVLDDFAETPLFASSNDVIGVDPYPVYKDIPAKQERCIDAMDAVERSGQTCWAVPQIFNWGSYRGRSNPDRYKKYLVPTLEQMRGITLFEALRGARGFVFYCFYDLKRIGPYTNCPPDNREPFLKRWAEVKQLATMLKFLEPWLLDEKSPVPVALDIQKGRAEAASFVDAEGRPLYIIANIGPKDLNASLRLPEGTPQMKALYGHATETAPGTWQFTGNDIWGEVLVPAE